MKQILIALLLAFTTSTVINAQKQSSIEKDSTENVKVTLSKKTDTKADESNTTVTVIGVDTTDMDTTAGKDDNDLPFGNLSDTISGGILISIIAIVAVFGLPVFILFVIFFFRYKNRKARYRLAEHPAPAPSGDEEDAFTGRLRARLPSEKFRSNRLRAVLAASETLSCCVNCGRSRPSRS